MKRMFYLFFVFLPILFSCTDETTSDTVTTSSGVVTKVSFSLSTVKMEGMVDTKSTDVTTIDDGKIDNLWVLQFQGGALVKNAYFSSVNTTSFDADLKAGANSNLYFVANVGSTAFSTLPANEAAFKIATKSLSAEADVFFVPSTGKKSVPMFGSLTIDVPLTGYIANQTVSLTRMLSRVDLAYTVNVPNFTLSKVRVCNLPKKMQYCPPTAGTLFPATPTAADVQNCNYTFNATNAGGTVTFYLPENQRGTGSNATTDSRLKNGNGADYATYLELVGYAKDADGSLVEVAYRVYPGADNVNDYNIVRNSYYTVNASITGISGSDARISRQLARSNCYMVKPGDMIRIPIQRANESTELGTQIADVTSSGWTANVLWQTEPSLVTVSNTAADRANGIFRVTAGATAGNAVVYIKNAAGNIIWSWHIWVTDYDPAVTNQSFNNYKWMDRNLGATTSTNSVSSFGLYYQWGRKDPEIGIGSYNGGSSPSQALYTASGGSYSWPAAAASDPGAGNNLKNSVQNPSTHYFAGTIFNDWYSNYGAYLNATLWNTAKTIYDPCPVGWKVPPGSATGGAWASLTEATFPYNGLGRTITSCSAFYPLTGYRSSSTGALNAVGSGGYYWSSTPYSDATNAYDLRFDYPTGILLDNNNNRAMGFNVRCVKE